MRDGQLLRAIYYDMQMLFFCFQENTAQSQRQCLIYWEPLLLQRNGPGLQTGRLYHRVHQKIQLIKLYDHRLQVIDLLSAWKLLLQKERCRHFQIRSRCLDLVGYIRNHALQVSPLLFYLFLVISQHLIQPVQPMIDPIQQCIIIKNDPWRRFALHHIVNRLAHIICKKGKTRLQDPDQNKSPRR